MFILFISEIKKNYKKFYYFPKKIYKKTVNQIIAYHYYLGTFRVICLQHLFYYKNQDLVKTLIKVKIYKKGLKSNWNAIKN